LVGGLLRAELLLALLARQQEPRLELAEGGDQDEELGDGLQVELELAVLAHVVDVRDDDRTERNLRQRDLLTEQDRQQQVEGPLEDVQIEIELGDRGHAPTIDGGPASEAPLPPRLALLLLGLEGGALPLLLLLLALPRRGRGSGRRRGRHRRC